MNTRESYTPLVSVVMPVKNAESTVRDSITSILNQSMGDFEFIIIDDNSSDKTESILEEFECSDSRIRIFKNSGQGICDALNHAIECARSPFIARMDADDIAFPERFQHQIAEFKGNSNLVLVGSYYFTFSFDQSKLSPVKIPIENNGLKQSIQLLPTFGHPTIMAATVAVREIGGYRKEFEGAEDHDLYLRLSGLGEFAAVPEYLLKYRLHPGQITQTQRARVIRASIAAVYSHQCILENSEDPAISGKSCDQLAMEFLSRTSHLHGPISPNNLKLCVRAIRGLGEFPDQFEILMGFKRQILKNLFRFGQYKAAFKFWNATRKSKWL